MKRGSIAHSQVVIVPPPEYFQIVVDIVRNQAMGITGQMKLANLAEMFGKNTHGGHSHVVAAIRNDD